MHVKKNYPYFYKGSYYNHRSDIVRGSIVKTAAAYIRSLFSVGSFIKQELPVVCDYGNIVLFPQEYDLPVVIPAGHATVLIMYKGVSIVIDPLFFSSSWFFRRYVPCTPHYNLFPPCDFLLLSHDHPDHCDISSLKIIKNAHGKVQTLTPLGMKNIVEKAGINNIIEKTWWQSTHYVHNNIQIKFTCLPALHWSQHGLFSGRNSSLWCSWMIELDDYVIYFAGDSAYGDHFKAIGQSFPYIDCALLPIAPYSPEKYQLDSHMTSEQVVNAFEDLHAQVFVPIHWGVLRLGSEPLVEPLHNIINCMQEKSLLNKLHGIAIGDRVVISNDYRTESIDKEYGISRGANDQYETLQP